MQFKDIETKTKMKKIKKIQVEEVLLAGNKGTDVKFLCSEKFDMESTFKTLSYSELAEKITNTGIIIIEQNKKKQAEISACFYFFGK